MAKSSFKNRRTLLFLMVILAVALVFAKATVLRVTGAGREVSKINTLQTAPKDLAGVIEGPGLSQDKQQKSNTAETVVAEELAKGKKPNRLIHQKSPYLLQHAFNPVDWYPWGEEAFRKARKENKPIFVSIGYSTCHWCHVMEQESFDNPDIADIMNKYFVCVKVDREERPDLDQVYMSATRVMTGGGGWPMSVFLTHDLKPFYAGTYFPPNPRYGLPGFRDLLQAIHRSWVSDRDRLLRSADKITESLRQLTAAPAGGGKLTEAMLTKGYDQTARIYDRIHGGFGGAPKFPRPVTLNFLLRYHHRRGEKKALDMVLTTLQKMSKGGIHDHIGGGFHRYSVDERWHVPHFEKMLYDQAQLAVSYLEAYQVTKDLFYAQVAREILDYVLRDMTPPTRDSFYSAEDADSPLPENLDQKGEGAFYVWTAKEMERSLDANIFKIFSYAYGVKEAGNVTSDAQGEFTGKNILYLERTVDETARQFDRSVNEVERLLKQARDKLFLARIRRPRPHLDDKVITSWNGLMIGAFARGYQVLNEPRYLETAEGAAGFILTSLYDANKKLLLRRYRDGSAGLEAHLDDYAFLVHGLLDLYEASLNIRWLTYAMDLTERQIALFWDENRGGFYDTSGKDKTVLLRTKGDHDGAEPTGNSIAALNLLRLAQMTDNDLWRRKGEQTIAAFAEQLQQSPTGMPQMLAAFDFQLGKIKQIIIAGAPKAADTQKMLREVHARYLPNKVILLADGGEGQERLSKHLPFLRNVRPLEGKATAYVCENYSCKLPTSDIGVMVGQLK